MLAGVFAAVLRKFMFDNKKPKWYYCLATATITEVIHMLMIFLTNMTDARIDELFGNIAHYAYKPETGPATVRVEVTETPISVIVTFIDHGIPYDPLKKDDPDVTLSAEERAIGGLGIFMVKKTMDEITYEYKDGQNILSIRKDL